MSYRYILLPGIAGIIVAASCLHLAGCDVPLDPNERRSIDRCIYRDVFAECVRVSPDNVEDCSDVAVTASHRRVRDITAGCR